MDPDSELSQPGRDCAAPTCEPDLKQRLGVLESRLPGRKDTPTSRGKGSAGPAETLLSRIKEPVAQKQRPVAGHLAAALGSAGEEEALVSDEGEQHSTALSCR